MKEKIKKIFVRQIKPNEIIPAFYVPVESSDYGRIKKAWILPLALIMLPINFIIVTFYHWVYSINQDIRWMATAIRNPKEPPCQK